MNKRSGFTLIELVVVIVILAILAAFSMPKLVNFQRDAHASRANTAFLNFTSATVLFHTKWLVEGEPAVTQSVDYGQEEIYPSAQGFPISVNQLPLNDGQAIRGSDCVALWQALLSTDITIRSQTTTGTVLPSTTDIVSWYTSQNECYYYYTTGYSADENLPILYYSPLTGETRITSSRASSTPQMPLTFPE